MSYVAPLLPENAPFRPAERAWINGWLAARCAPEEAALPANAVPPAADLPWHDMSLPLEERLQLAAGRPLPQVLMAAMAQQDCGQCSYLCETYAAAIARGEEKSLTRCVPGGKATARALRELLESGPLPATAAVPATAAASAPAPRPDPARPARFVGAAPLNRAGSAKDTRHVVFDLSGTGLDFTVGDSLGLHAANCPETVAMIVARLDARADKEVDCPDGRRRPLFEALSLACDIGRPSDEAVEVLASRARDLHESQRLQALAEGYPGAEPAEADLLDLLLAFPSAKPPVQELVSALSQLQPRLYSISNSLKAAPQAVHLTVAAVRWQKRGRLRKGIASTYLAERLQPGAAVPVFIQKAHAFGLPDSPDAPIIMIGPGTGVAPFRAFLQERRAIGARGRNWLFFGDQRRASDFLYEDELADWHRDGHLTRLDLAFSRDQEDRIYVQQRMRENAAELWAWLQDGAHILVCGAATMARDVDTALAAIIARQGGMGSGAAKSHLASLARAGRYLRDVY